jgi:hypothetical protein
MWKRTAQSCLQRRLLTTPPSPPSWRKDQLDKLKRKFLEPAQIIKGDEDLQPMWQAMERRVKNRLPPRKDGKKGRTNVKKTDEDVWLEQGLYDHLKSEPSKSK